MLFMAGLALSLITGCSKDDGNNVVGPDNNDSEYMWVHLNGDSTKVEYDDLAVFDINTIGKRIADKNDAI